MAGASSIYTGRTENVTKIGTDYKKKTAFTPIIRAMDTLKHDKTTIVILGVQIKSFRITNGQMTDM